MSGKFGRSRRARPARVGNKWQSAGAVPIHIHDREEGWKW